MGQYYTPVLIDEENGDEKRYLSHDYGNGLKLMEHSYIGNNFVETVCSEILEHPMRVAWVGNYADDVVGENKYKDIPNIKRFLEIEDNQSDVYNKPNEVEGNVSSLLYYILNYTKKEYICMYDYVFNQNKSNIHPLPLLTSIGNGLGGGDYHGTSDELCGNWCGDVIECNYYDNVYKLLDEYKDITATLKFNEN